MFRILLCNIFWFSIGAVAADLQFVTTMNGINLDTYKDFAKWNLVTVRYREDSGELRFVYANDLAFNALKKGEKFPDGSVFVKEAKETVEDRSFPDSKVPSQSARFQLMVRDKKKYADTEGWGYALFQPSGRIMTKNPEDQTKACLSCHSVVQDRQYVFSQIAKLGLQADVKKVEKLEERPRYSFETVDVSKLSKEAQNKVPSQFKKVRLLVGKMVEHTFFGTISEVRMLMTQEAGMLQMPAVLDSKSGDYSMVVYPGDVCEDKEDKGRSFETDIFVHQKMCIGH